MSYVMFLVTEIIGFAFLFFTYRGVFDLLTAFLVVVLMLALSFHVMVRKPDGTSIRMACFTAALWMAAIVSARLFFEFRSWTLSTFAFFLLVTIAIAAGFSTYSLIQRPTEMDIED